MRYPDRFPALLFTTFAATLALTPMAFAESAGPSGDQPTAAGSQQPADAEPAAASESDAQAAPQAVESEGDDPYAEAKTRVKTGSQLYEDGNYDAALTEFQRAYDTMLGHPARSLLLFNIGKCEEKLYRYDAAIEAYEKYLTQAADDADDRATVTAKIELLEGLLGTLTVEVRAKGGKTPGYEVWIDGRKIGAGVSRLRVPGGNHEVEVRAEGFETAKKNVQLTAQSVVALQFELSPLAEEYKGLPPAIFWSAAGLAAATAATGGVFGLLAVTERSNIDSQLDQGPPQSLTVTEDDQDKVAQLALTADIFFITSGVLATGAIVLGFMTDFGDDEAPVKEPEAPTVDVGVLPGGGFLTVKGAF